MFGVDLTSDASSYSGVGFTPSSGTTFGSIATLSTDYNVGASDCGGGAPRFEIDLASGKSVFVYFGPTPISNPGNCFYGWQKTGNVIGMNDGRWDTSQVCAGTQITTYTAALSCVGASAAVSFISVVVDAGYTATRGQDVTISNFKINNKVFSP